jgi:hypothetical protein
MAAAEGQEQQQQQASARLWRYSEVLAVLFGRVGGRDARAALCAAYSALAGRVPELQQPAQLLLDLNSWAAGQLDERDYERRLAAAAALTVEAWAGMQRLQVSGLGGGRAALGGLGGLLGAPGRPWCSRSLGSVLPHRGLQRRGRRGGGR